MATAPGFLPGESHGQRSLVSTVRRVAKSWTRLMQFELTAQHSSYDFWTCVLV